MRNSTKRILACLVVGTAAVGVKYKLEQVEKERKNRKGKKVREIQNKKIQEKEDKEKKGKYINFEKEEAQQHQKIKDIQIERNEGEKKEALEDSNTQNSDREVINISTVTKEQVMSTNSFRESFTENNPKNDDNVKEHYISDEVEEYDSCEDNIVPIKEEETISAADDEQEKLEIKSVSEKSSLEELPAGQAVITEETMDEQTDTIQSGMIEEITPVAMKTQKEDTSITEDFEQNNKEETVDLEDAKKILKKIINWQEAESVQTKIDYLRLPAAAVLNVSELSLPEIKSLFTIQDITDEIFKRIYAKSYKVDCILPKEELRYLRMLYYGFDDKTHVGEMIVNVSIAEDIRDIFYLLYQEKYPIERIVLVDEYNADDILSMEANNTSGFNYRKIDGMSVMSKHSRGLAVDINPKYNPYIRTMNGEVNCQPKSGEAFMDREKSFQYKIDHEDLCYCLFRTYGFIWGGDWEDIKDYQHFQKQC